MACFGNIGCVHIDPDGPWQNWVMKASTANSEMSASRWMGSAFGSKQKQFLMPGDTIATIYFFVRV